MFEKFKTLLRNWNLCGGRVKFSTKPNQNIGDGVNFEYLLYERYTREKKYGKRVEETDRHRAREHRLKNVLRNHKMIIGLQRAHGWVTTPCDKFLDSPGYGRNNKHLPDGHYEAKLFATLNRSYGVWVIVVIREIAANVCATSVYPPTHNVSPICQTIYHGAV